jgi:hypothetical protein
MMEPVESAKFPSANTRQYRQAPYGLHQMIPQLLAEEKSQYKAMGMPDGPQKWENSRV